MTREAGREKDGIRSRLRWFMRVCRKNSGEWQVVNGKKTIWGRGGKYWKQWQRLSRREIPRSARNDGILGCAGSLRAADRTCGHAFGGHSRPGSRGIHGHGDPRQHVSSLFGEVLHAPVLQVALSWRGDNIRTRL